MGANKDKDKAEAKAKAREKAKTRKAQERAQLSPTPEWSAGFREEFTRLLGTVNIQAELDQMDGLVAEVERRMFRERMKPAAAATEAFRSVRSIIQQRQNLKLDPDSIRFSIHELPGVKHIVFDHFQVRINLSPEGGMEYVLDGLEGCDMDVFKDLVRLAQEQKDGEYYLHGVGAYEWWLNNKGERPTYEQLTVMARQLYRNERYTTRFQL